MVSANLTCLARQVALRVLRQHLRQNQQVVERRAQLVRHVRQELRFVLRGERKLLGLLFQRLLGLFHFAILALHLRLLLGQQLAPFPAARRWCCCNCSCWLFSSSSEACSVAACCSRRLLVLVSSSCWLCSSSASACDCFSSSSVRMVAAMVLSTMPMALGELIEERQVDLAEAVERGQLDHRLHLAFEQHRQHDDAQRRRFAQARADLDVIRRHVGEQNALLLERALADQSFAQLVLVGQTSCAP